MVPIATWEITSNDDPFMSISLSIYCSGCDSNCPGCHSPDLQNPSNGKLLTSTQILDLISNRLDLIESVVFLGGEWMKYKEDLQFLSQAVKYLNRKTILYTGQLLEDIPTVILSSLDIIIDGPYKQNLKTNYAVPASSNQRVFVKAYQDFLFYAADKTKDEHHILINPKQLPINREI